MGKSWSLILIATCLGSVALFAEEGTDSVPPLQIVVSVAEQKLALVQNGGVLRKYPISTSKFGLGDGNNTYKTPLGHLRVCDKVGDNLALGAVLKSRNATGEILQVNAPGRDPIVTRILWLEGLEAGNRNARDRGIYIHGTVEESRLGQPVSYGCIRMRSRDVVELFDCTPVGTPVQIITERLPNFRKATSKPDLLLASNERVRTTFGPRGMVSVSTVPREDLGGDLPPLPAKVPAVVRTAKAEAPAPIEDGPTIVLKAAPPRPPEPTVVLALKGSILMAGLTPKPAPVAVLPAPESAAVPRVLFLQIVAAVDLLASPEEARRQTPLDHLSAALLNPPSVQFRLAFRTTADLPEL